MVSSFLQLKDDKGFTLVELLTVTVIISILSVLILPNYRLGEKNLALQRSAQKLAQDIRRTQEMAMSAKEITNPNNPNSEKVIPDGGYGIYFGPLVSSECNDNCYIIFADCNANREYDSGKNCGTGSDRFSEKIEEIKLESKVKIKRFSPSPLHITFSPPDPTTNIEGSQARIILSNDNGQTKTIIVNKVGLIYVQ